MMLLKCLTDVARGYRSGTLNIPSIAKQCVTIIRKKDPKIGAWADIYEGDVYWQSKMLDDEAKKSQFRSNLHGIPFGIKDLIDTVPYPTRGGSESFARFPTSDASIVRKLKEKGALIIGKTVSSEFGCSFDPVPTVNPLNNDYTPGGSSCGSAAAIAAGMCYGAIATQTAGSTLRPAAFCGVTGYKPTKDLFPMDGVFPVSQELDSIGFITRNIYDMIFIVDVLLEKQYTDSLINTFGEKNLTIYYPKEWILSEADKETIAVFDEVIEFLNSKGISIMEIAMPCTLQHITKVHRIFMLYQAYQIHCNFFPKPHDAFYKSVTALKLFEEAKMLSENDFQWALGEKRQIQENMDMLLEKDYSILMLPTAPTLPPLKTVGTGSPVFCSPWNVMGYPSVCIPICDRPFFKLLYSIQFVTKQHRDLQLLHSARQINTYLLDRYMEKD